MKILLSNDDGVHAPGLQAMYQALKTVSDEVYVMAPDSERSGSSSAITITRPLQVAQLPSGFWTVNGTPADCVYLACNGFFEHEFDLVVSGINSGANLGDDVMYSGTVGAAREGRMMALPAIAVSLVGASVRQYTEASSFKTAADWVAGFIQSGLPELPERHILNINVPDTDSIAGAKVTRMGARHTAMPVQKEKDPRGKEILWIGLAGDEQPLNDGIDLITDFQAVAQNYVSVTPVQMDVTSYSQIDKLKAHAQLGD